MKKVLKTLSLGFVAEAMIGVLLACFCPVPDMFEKLPLEDWMLFLLTWAVWAWVLDVVKVGATPLTLMFASGRGAIKAKKANL